MPETLQNKLLARLQNNRVLAVAGAAGVVLIGVGSFTNALDSVLDVLNPGPSPRLVQEYCELLAPISVQFDRTLSAFNRYPARDLAVEGTLADGNTKARELLESKAQLVPPSLVDARDDLVYHYDRWLEEYRRVRRIHRDSVQAFIFVGPDGAPFPRWAADAFVARRDSVLGLLGWDFACT